MNVVLAKKIVRRFMWAVVASSVLMPLPAVAVDETAIEAPGPQGPLGGAFLAAADPRAPVVLIVPGSGPTDRDGNNPLGIRASTYKLIAEGLAAEGIASVRVDKRGMFSSAKAVADPNAVTMADYAADIAGWIEAIRKKTGASCVWLLGHSEGGLAVLTASADLKGGVCGLILVATPGRKAGDVLREQLKNNPANAPILDNALKAIGALEAGRKVDPSTLPGPLRQLFPAEVQPFLIDLFAKDPAKQLAGSSVPALVLQGKRDIQVGKQDAELLGKARAGVTVRLIDNANHVLKSVAADDMVTNLATYSDPSLPLADGVVSAIAGFVKNGKAE